jgi:hypothetical protein
MPLQFLNDSVVKAVVGIVKEKIEVLKSDI